jgi:transposase
VAATSEGHLSAVQGPLEGDLVRVGYSVVRVHTRLMAAARRTGRERANSDPIDAEAVALAALRDPDLPVARLDGPTRQVKLLSYHRHDLVVERTKLCSRLRWHLHELDPELHVPSRGLRRFHVLDELTAQLDRFDGTVARIARELVARCRELTTQINALERELEGLVKELGPNLLAIAGVRALAAATIPGETAGASRFKSKHAFDRFNGTASVPVWSSNKVRVRLNRGGNRIGNSALHMAAVTQTRGIRSADRAEGCGRRLDIEASGRPGGRVPVHRGGAGRAAQREACVRAAVGLPIRLLPPQPPVRPCPRRSGPHRRDHRDPRRVQGHV